MEGGSTLRERAESAAESVSAAAGRAETQATDASGALQARGQQLASDAQTRTAELQEAAADVVASAAGRFGAILPQVLLLLQHAP